MILGISDKVNFTNYNERIRDVQINNHDYDVALLDYAHNTNPDGALCGGFKYR